MCGSHSQHLQSTAVVIIHIIFCLLHTQCEKIYSHIYRDNILHYTYTLQTKGLILQYKFYGSSTDDPARDRSARALARIKVRLSLPYNRQVAWDFEQFPLVAM